MNKLNIIAIFSIGILGILLMSLRSDTPQTRGIRNKNPLNIRGNNANNWRGEVGRDDLDFVIFDTAENGIRAATRILNSYARRGVNKLDDIILTWSPKIENPTDNYILYVSRALNLPVDAEITSRQFPQLLYAMTFFENGSNPYNLDTFNKGVASA